MVIEGSQGEQVNYAYDEEWDAMRQKWTLTGNLASPFDYGFVPQTRGGDGSLLDVSVLGSKSMKLGAIVECRPLGMIKLVDSGLQDDKILAVPVKDPACEGWKGLSDLPFDYRKTFEDFFRELGAQKRKTMEITGFEGPMAAMEELKAAHERFHG